jgi:lipopolysaccharide transport system ATP-binding protein
MTTPAISVRNLSKCYTLGSIGRHTLVEEAQYWWHKLRGQDPREHMTKIGHTVTESRRVEAEQEGAEQFWALKDVSFDIHPGEVVGIIGRNGAGKSTLLKILSRITEPTEGEAVINGRVGSLLEVGTGFHPELTGRENVFMNGTILGMKKREIASKFDEIVGFAELEKFIDTPVKRYSSGMYVRLAFAVAAHLEPEILVVDEVLAVGDAEFQRKCLGKMGAVARAGRTILFVSHNMSSLLNLCQRGLLLEQGQLKHVGSIDEVVSNYMLSDQAQGILVRPWPEDRNPRLHIRKISLLGANGVATSFSSSETMTVEIECVVSQRINGAQIAFELLTELDECILSSTNQDKDGVKRPLEPGEYSFSCSVPLDIFRAGRYRVRVSSSVPKVELLDVVKESLVFELHDNMSPIHKLGQKRRGIILPVYPWEMQVVSPGTSDVQ